MITRSESVVNHRAEDVILGASDHSQRIAFLLKLMGNLGIARVGKDVFGQWKLDQICGTPEGAGVPAGEHGLRFRPVAFGAAGRAHERGWLRLERMRGAVR